MKLLEHEGKTLFKSYGITVPRSQLVENAKTRISLELPIVLKSQVPAGDRKKKGGIVVVKNAEQNPRALEEIFQTEIDGHIPKSILTEEMIDFVAEYYVSFSYSSEFRSPVLALNSLGGSGVASGVIIPVDVLLGCTPGFVTDALIMADIKPTEAMIQVVMNLWKAFTEEHLVLAEINPLFVLKDESVVAGDAKVIRDDALIENVPKPFVSLGGDIAIIASGGGASMLNIDILMRAGGKPANYVEYSGNPPASVVEELTKRVLSQPGIRGLWVIGGTANFTDIYETMMGFVAGLRLVTPMPTYPIVIRRDGPRQKEAKEMLLEVAASEGYDMHIYGPELSMSQSASELLKLTQTK